MIVYTHVFLWWRSNDQLLQGTAKPAIADADVVAVSEGLTLVTNDRKLEAYEVPIL